MPPKGAVDFSGCPPCDKYQQDRADDDCDDERRRCFTSVGMTATTRVIKSPSTLMVDYGGTSAHKSNDDTNKYVVGTGGTLVPSSFSSAITTVVAVGHRSCDDRYCHAGGESRLGVDNNNNNKSTTVTNNKSAASPFIALSSSVNKERGGGDDAPKNLAQVIDAVLQTTDVFGTTKDMPSTTNAKTAKARDIGPPNGVVGGINPIFVSATTTKIPQEHEEQEEEVGAMTRQLSPAPQALSPPRLMQQQQRDSSPEEQEEEGTAEAAETTSAVTATAATKRSSCGRRSSVGSCASAPKQDKEDEEDAAADRCDERAGRGEELGEGFGHEAASPSPSPQESSAAAAGEATADAVAADAPAAPAAVTKRRSASRRVSLGPCVDTALVESSRSSTTNRRYCARRASLGGEIPKPNETLLRPKKKKKRAGRRRSSLDSLHTTMTTSNSSGIFPRLEPKQRQTRRRASMASVCSTNTEGGVYSLPCSGSSGMTPKLKTRFAAPRRASCSSSSTASSWSSFHQRPHGRYGRRKSCTSTLTSSSTATLGDNMAEMYPIVDEHSVDHRWDNGLPSGRASANANATAADRAPVVPPPPMTAATTPIIANKSNSDSILYVDMMRPRQGRRGSMMSEFTEVSGLTDIDSYFPEPDNDHSTNDDDHHHGDEPDRDDQTRDLGERQVAFEIEHLQSLDNNDNDDDNEGGLPLPPPPAEVDRYEEKLDDDHHHHDRHEKRDEDGGSMSSCRRGASSLEDHRAALVPGRCVVPHTLVVQQQPQASLVVAQSSLVEAKKKTNHHHREEGEQQGGRRRLEQGSMEMIGNNSMVRFVFEALEDLRSFAADALLADERDNHHHHHHHRHHPGMLSFQLEDPRAVGPVIAFADDDNNNCDERHDDHRDSSSHDSGQHDYLPHPTPRHDDDADDAQGDEPDQDHQLQHQRERQSTEVVCASSGINNSCDQIMVSALSIDLPDDNCCRSAPRPAAAASSAAVHQHPEQPNGSSLHDPSTCSVQIVGPLYETAAVQVSIDDNNSSNNNKAADDDDDEESTVHLEFMEDDGKYSAAGGGSRAEGGEDNTETGFSSTTCTKDNDNGNTLLESDVVDRVFLEEMVATIAREERRQQATTKAITLRC